MPKNKDPSKWTKRKCLNCGDEFDVRLIYVKRGKGKFCDTSCGISYRNKTNNPSWRSEVRKKISENHADVSGIKNPMYGRKGLLAPAYIDGRNKFVGESYRKKALANLPHKCVMCDEEDLSKIDVHHKDGNKKNNELSNLVLLCRKCHLTKAHRFHRDKKRGVFIGADLNKEVIL